MGALQPSGDLPIVLFFFFLLRAGSGCLLVSPLALPSPMLAVFSLSSSVVVQGRISPQRASARASSPLGGVTTPRSLHANLPNDGIPKPTCHTCAPLGPSAVEIGNLRFLLTDVARAKRWSRLLVGARKKQDRRKNEK